MVFYVFVCELFIFKSFFQSSGFQFFNQFDAMVTILDVGLEMKIKYKNLTDDKTTHTKWWKKLTWDMNIKEKDIQFL
jgi:hypothetical protein